MRATVRIAATMLCAVLIKLVGEQQNRATIILIETKFSGPYSGISTKCRRRGRVSSTEHKTRPLHDAAISTFDQIFAFGRGGIVSEKTFKDRFLTHGFKSSSAPVPSILATMTRNLQRSAS